MTPDHIAFQMHGSCMGRTGIVGLSGRALALGTMINR